MPPICGGPVTPARFYIRFARLLSVPTQPPRQRPGGMATWPLAAGPTERAMSDLLYLLGGCAFFALAILYTTACDHL